MKKTEEKGITLIALIITIIVMLILVGVTVTVALNGGLFTTAKYAVDRTTQEKEKELIQVAYSDYNMQKYSNKKTDDFDMLETYFLGKAKIGLDINSLIDDEKSTDEVNYFKNIDISITEDDLEYTDSDLLYIYFKYNNNRYKLTVNDNGAITQKLEVMPKLEVQDAVVNDETDGWKITFNFTGNSYNLLENGNITNKWWKLTNEEKNQLYEDSEVGVLEIAKNEFSIVGISAGSTNVEQGNNVLSIFTNPVENQDMEWWMLPLNDAGIEYIKSNKDVEVEKYKWYHFTGYPGNLNGWEEYKGESPINLGDFTDEQIYCKSYLERIIKSFNQ